MSEYGEPRFEVSFSPTDALAMEAERACWFNWRNALLLAVGVFRCMKREDNGMASSNGSSLNLMRPRPRRLRGPF